MEKAFSLSTVLANLVKQNEYDSNSKLIHIKSNKGEETWYEYDSNGKLIRVI